MIARVTIVTLLLYTVISAFFIITDPAPWPDEAIYADIANTWIRDGRLATDLWKDSIPGVHIIAGWNPPLYFYATILIFKLAGASLLSQRFLSVVIGGFVLLLIINIARQLNPKLSPLLLGILGVALLTDYQFMVATRIARPEIVALFFGYLSWWLLIRWTNYSPATSFQSLLLGICASLAGIVHPLGFSMISIGIIDWFVKKTNRVHLFSYLLGSLLPIATWIISYMPHGDIIRRQIELAATRKFLEDPWVITAFKLNLVLVEIIFILIGIISATLMVLLIKKYSRVHLLLTSLTIIFAAVVMYGRMAWYIVYLLPPLYLTIISRIKTRSTVNVLLISLFTALILVNSRYSYKQLRQAPRTTTAYAQYCHQIISTIPDGTTVFLSAVPEPYYCFQNRQNHLIEFPVYYLTLPEYSHILSQASYVVYQGSYETILFGDFLQKYLEANTEIDYPIKDSTGTYKASVIKLKPLPQRTP